MKPSLTLACDKRNFVMAASRWENGSRIIRAGCTTGLAPLSSIFGARYYHIIRMQGGCEQNTRHNGGSAGHSVESATRIRPF